MVRPWPKEAFERPFPRPPSQPAAMPTLQQGGWGCVPGRALAVVSPGQQGAANTVNAVGQITGAHVCRLHAVAVSILHGRTPADIPRVIVFIFKLSIKIQNMAIHLLIFYISTTYRYDKHMVPTVTFSAGQGWQVMRPDKDIGGQMPP